MTGEASAIVLAGGRSTRLGQDKRLVRLDSERTLLERTVQRVASLVEDVVVVVGAGERLTDDLARVVTDEWPGTGPLGGLCTGLARVCHAYALVVACDLPFLNVDVLRALLARPRAYDLLVPRRADGTVELLHGIYRTTCLPVARDRLAAGRLRLAGLIDDLQAADRTVVFVDEDDLRPFDPDLRTFFNLNTPADLHLARALVGPNANEASGGEVEGSGGEGLEVGLGKQIPSRDPLSDSQRERGAPRGGTGTGS